jgi:mono/diheme cytochrome c family protein
VRQKEKAGMNTLRGSKTLLAVLALATSLYGTAKDPAVTPTQGESWLNHLHRNFDDTSMGKTGQLGPAEDVAGATGGVSPFFAKPSVTLRGADLYRMNCRGCHGEAGTGAPPEINSVINPVRAGSLALVLERMKQTGMAMSRAEAAAMAKQSQDALVDRLHHGGKDMPAFPQLSDSEVATILAYLKQLAAVPGAEAEQRTVQESSPRIGELIVKSTCHTCHSASGANPDPQQLSEGAIPPLSTLTTRLNQAEFVRKVTSGKPIVAGTPALQCRGRMPVFYYLSEEEAADVYLYLTLYPPAPADELGPQIASARPALAASFLGGVGGGGSNPSAPQADATGVIEILVGLFVVGSLALLMAGIAFSVREIIKLSDRTEGRRRQWSWNVPAREIETDSPGIVDAGADAA